MSLWTWIFGKPDFHDRYPTGERTRRYKKTPDRPEPTPKPTQWPEHLRGPRPDTTIARLAQKPIPRVERPTFTEEQIAFLERCYYDHVRLTYAGLSALKLPNLSNPINRGRHGATLLKFLPEHLQPLICRSDGSYHPRAIQQYRELDEKRWVREGDIHYELFHQVSTWPIIPKENVAEAFSAYLDFRKTHG